MASPVPLQAEADPSGGLAVRGISAAGIGDLAARHGIALYSCRVLRAAVCWLASSLAWTWAKVCSEMICGTGTAIQSSSGRGAWLVDVVTGQPVRRGDQHQVQLGQRGVIPEPVQSRARQMPRPGRPTC
jgi:hypothetical protein